VLCCDRTVVFGGVLSFLNLGPLNGGPLSFLFVATQYEIPFKLSICTFHVSVIAITPAIAKPHPSWSRRENQRNVGPRFCTTRQ